MRPIAKQGQHRPGLAAERANAEKVQGRAFEQTCRRLSHGIADFGQCQRREDLADFLLCHCPSITLFRCP